MRIRVAIFARGQGRLERVVRRKRKLPPRDSLHLAGSVFAKPTPIWTHFFRFAADLRPAGATRTHPLDGRPVRENGFASLLLITSSCLFGPTPTSISSPMMPQATLPRPKNATPPNCSFSQRPLVEPTTPRTHLANFKLY